MLIENLYTLDSFINENNTVTATITINASHKIFEGHFPQQPVLPGVCQLQIVKELVERALNKKVILSEAGVCKFLQMIDPVTTNFLSIIINYNFDGVSCSGNAIIKSGEITFLKMNGIFHVVE